ncbi:unnamed protein product [Cochlearia groenlandica]
MPANLEPLDLCIQIPYHFRCPISLELMRDPVTVCTGQTYDRSSIESWVSAGNNTTCPVTRAPLSDFTFIPNHTLRRLIQEWCVANRSNGVERIPTPKQPADPSSVRALISQASAKSGAHVSVRSRAAALRRLRGFARDSEKNRVLIAAHNAGDVLIRILFSDDSPPELVSESLSLIVMLPMTDPERCVSIASDPGRVEFLTQLLFDSSMETRVNAAALIEIALTGSKSADPDQKVTISNSESIFEGVLDLLRNPISSYPRRALKIGIKALFALCLPKQTRRIAVAAGAPEILIDRLAADFDRCDTERALATVELLCRLPEGCAAFGEHALTVPLLVKTILRVSDRATEYAAGALLAICTAEERWRDEAAAAGVVVKLLLMVQSECTERAKKKAQKLLKLLRDSWPDYSFANNSDDFGCSEVVPF